MKFRVTMKTPDTTETAIRDALRRAAPQATQKWYDASYRQCIACCESWFQYGEHVTLVIDTADNICRVVAVL